MLRPAATRPRPGSHSIRADVSALADPNHRRRVLPRRRTAAADPQTDALCRPIQGEWESVARGNDPAAMDREIAKIPPFCAALTAQAQRRRTAVANQLNQSRLASAQAAHKNAVSAERDQALAVVAAAKTSDDAAYAIAKATDSAAAYQAYLSAYPSGRHSSEALAARSAVLASAEESKASLSTADVTARGDKAFQSANYGDAARWYRIAASQGDANAQSLLGYLLQAGLKSLHRTTPRRCTGTNSPPLKATHAARVTLATYTPLVSASRRIGRRSHQMVPLNRRTGWLR